MTVDVTGVASHLLIVEDEPMIGRILEHKLVREGHRVSWVRSAAEARQVLAEGGVDLALVDATLECDGIEFGASMAATSTAPRRGWLALVEVRDQAAPGRSLAAGAVGVVVKPFKPTAVAVQVDAALRGAAV
jgi:DNA-binding response OmpR family regulator